jgi:hypothetical protein
MNAMETCSSNAPPTISTKIIKKLGEEFCKVSLEALFEDSLMGNKRTSVAIHRPVESINNSSGGESASEDDDEVSSNLKGDGKKMCKASKE